MGSSSGSKTCVSASGSTSFSASEMVLLRMGTESGEIGGDCASGESDDGACVETESRGLGLHILHRVRYSKNL